MLKIIDACGSLLIMDEEESTVHFAHHSIKQYLLSDPTDLTVEQYHVRLREAEIQLGEICTTYLNLDTLNLQMKAPSKCLEIQPIQIPLAISTSSTASLRVVNKFAIQLLKANRPCTYDPQNQLQQTASLLQGPKAEQTYSFTSYAREYWLFHSRLFEQISVSNSKSISLWIILIEGVPGLMLPWAPEDLYDLGPKFSLWISHNQHGALLRQVIDFHKRLDDNITGYTSKKNLYRQDLLLFLGMYGPSLKLEPRFYGNALDLAIQERNETVVRLLLDNGVNINAVHPPSHIPLKIAIISGHKRIAQLLLERGAYIEADGEKDDALVLAAQYGRCEIVKLLLERGASIDHQDSYTRTALYAALKSGQTAAVKLLLDKGADIGVVMEGEEYHTALSAAIGRDQADEKVVPMLLDKVSGVDARSRVDKNPLHIAAAKGLLSIVQLLLEKGAYVNARNGRGDSPLFLAVSNNHMEIVYLLLEKGANVDASNRDGTTALHAAATKHHMTMVWLLLKWGADVNKGNLEGTTALHITMADPLMKMVGMLLSYGADPAAVDKAGSTPRSLACAGNHKEVVDLIDRTLASRALHKTHDAHRREREEQRQ